MLARMEIAKKRPPGRPRSDASREAILDAAYWQTMRLGYPAVTAASIAKAAGAGKQTLYRWWPSKAAVILDAFAQKSRARIDRPLEAATRNGDLPGFLRAALAAAAADASILRHLMGEAQLDAQLLMSLRERLIEPQRAALRRILEASIPDASSREGMVVAISGAIWCRLLLDEPLDEQLAIQLAALTCGKGRAS
jgi:AcrR family transcriptional regulator